MACPLVFAGGANYFMIGLESYPLDYQSLVIGLCLLWVAYLLWSPMGRVYLTIPYRRDLVSRALELDVQLSERQKKGYRIEETKRQIEKLEEELQKQEEKAK